MVQWRRSALSSERIGSELDPKNCFDRSGLPWHCSYHKSFDKNISVGMIEIHFDHHNSVHMLGYPSSLPNLSVGFRSQFSYLDPLNVVSFFYQASHSDLKDLWRVFDIPSPFRSWWGFLYFAELQACRSFGATASAVQLSSHYSIIPPMMLRCKKSILLSTSQLQNRLQPSVGGWRLTSLRYSPTSACLKHTMPVGSSLLASAVDLAVTPKP